MIRNASLFLATRYLSPRRSFLSVITLLSILGPILGVAVLVVVISVMAGFNRDIEEKILGMQAHIQIKSSLGNTIADSQGVLDELDLMGVTASPVIEGPVLIQCSQRVLAKYVKGILPEREQNVTDIRSAIIRGRFEIGEDEALIGSELALQTGVDIGDTILIHSPDKLNKLVEFDKDGSIRSKAAPEVYVPEEVTITGIFSLGMYEYDSNILVLHLDKASELFGLGWDAATSIQLRTTDPFDLEPIVTAINSNQKFAGLIPITWQQSNKRLFGALKVEKNLMFFLLIFIMVVAAFGIAATLITVVIQKTREIGVLKALGATPIAILLIFVYQGMFVGVIGTALGTALGLTVVHYRDSVANVLAEIMGTEIFPKDLYHLSEIPAMVQVSDVVVIVVSALLICLIGTLVPALYASALTPAEALRNEM